MNKVQLSLVIFLENSWWKLRLVIKVAVKFKCVITSVFTELGHTSLLHTCSKQIAGLNFDLNIISIERQLTLLAGNVQLSHSEAKLYQQLEASLSRLHWELSKWIKSCPPCSRSIKRKLYIVLTSECVLHGTALYCRSYIKYALTQPEHSCVGQEWMYRYSSNGGCARDNMSVYTVHLIAWPWSRSCLV